MRPKRIQRKRTSGWRMPSNTIYVGRPSKYGNPFMSQWSYLALWVYVLWLKTDPIGQQIAMDAVKELRGKNLACWCPLDAPCHADVLLEIANEGE